MTTMKNMMISAMLASCSLCQAQDIQLNEPTKNRGNDIMQTLWDRQSVREYSEQELSPQDLSDLLWATAGISRTDGRITSPTARNMQEIRVYVFNKDGAYLYDAKDRKLSLVVKGDHRKLIAGFQEFAAKAPVSILLVADFDKFGSDNEHARMMVYADAGIACENIYMFCAGTGMATVTRGTMDSKALQQLLGLTEKQVPVLNNPVGYPAKK